MKNYTVKQLADLSGVSVRTLHHYDAIGLLAPAHVGDNGYRIYERVQMLRLQQILFYRQLDMPLAEIKLTLDAPDFNLAKALQAHRKRLVAEQKRFSQLLLTIDETLNELNGEKEMENPYKGFSKEKQEKYQNELLESGSDKMREHIAEAKRNEAGLSKAQREEINIEGHTINLGLVECMNAEVAFESDKVQVLIARHHKWVSNYWVPNKQAYKGLGQTYIEHPEFRAFYDKYDTRLVEYLVAGMQAYANENLK